MIAVSSVVAIAIQLEAVVLYNLGAHCIENMVQAASIATMAECNITLGESKVLSESYRPTVETMRA